MDSHSSRKNTKPVPVIGLVGGVASGKSFVAEAFEDLGCARINADRIGHEMLDLPAFQQSIQHTFGDGVILADGQVNRAALGKLVFGDDDETQKRRQQLEQLLHPAIHAEAVERIRRFREAGSPPVAIILDVPLLIEAGWESDCDAIVFIDTPEDIRRQRALARGWTVGHWTAREQAQLPVEHKRRAATHIIPGDADHEDLKPLLKILLESLSLLQSA